MLSQMGRWARSRRGRRVGAGRRPAGVQPRLSIVVPVYNVEPYLTECLESILAQPYTDYEVVMVDDGSTDASGRIARTYAHRYADFRLIEQANGGLGAARNTGVDAARGDYLAFLDSDDRLPADAYSAMVSTLEVTGSDFAVGMLKREEAGRRFATVRMRDNHRVRRVGVTLEEMPRILADVFAVNKIFRRSFWDEAGLEFPVDTRYEDQPTLTQAFLAATRFDVLRETVYLWRIRHDGSSITQRRDDIADLRDRIVTKRVSTQAVAKMSPHLLDVWRADVLPVDMWEYFRAVPGCSDEYWVMLRAAMAEFWSEETVPFDRTWIPVQQRLMGLLVAQDRRKELEMLIDFVDGHRGDLPMELRGDRMVALLPGVDDPAVDLPETACTLAEHELRWEARITEATWDDGQLRLRGFALVRNAASAGHSTVLTGKWVTTDGSCEEGDSSALETIAEIQPTSMARATRFVGRPSQNYDDCGFTSTLNVAALASLRPRQATTWRLVLERRVEQLTRSGSITSFDRADVDRRPVEFEVPSSGGAARARAALREVDDQLLLEVRPV
jgi:glycosyltransferase involved in cell wall biosynthesis